MFAHGTRDQNSRQIHPSASATSSTFAGTATEENFLLLNASGSFKPCPVTVQTIRLWAGIFLNEYRERSASQHLNKPAMDAALAGSTKMPSFFASQAWASRISESCTISIAPRDSSIAKRACFQLAGFPIRIAEAIVSGASITRWWKIGAAPAA